MKTEAFIGLGSNLGDRLANLGRAVGLVAAAPGTEVVAVSEAVESEPWGVTEQPSFANAVARVRTTLPADELLRVLKEVESEMGRGPGERNGPRVIDLDLLLYGDEEWAGESLTLPHPRMAEREFVLRPLLELAPWVRWPDGSVVTMPDRPVGKVVGSLGQVPHTRPSDRAADEVGGFPQAAYVGDEDLIDDPEALERATEAANSDTRPFGADMPPGDEEWVPVAVAWGVRFDLDTALAVLRDSGIPAEPSSRPFSDKIALPMGSITPARVFVPASRAEEARAILGEASGGPSQR